MNYDVLSRKIEMLNNEYWILNFEIVVELGMLNNEFSILNFEIIIEVQPALGIAATSFLKGDRGTRSHILKRYSG